MLDAESKGLPVLKQVMYPRPAGFLTLIGQYQACLARNQPAIRYLHDMTLAYKDNVEGERTTHKTFLQGMENKMAGINMESVVGIDA